MLDKAEEAEHKKTNQKPTPPENSDVESTSSLIFEMCQIKFKDGISGTYYTTGILKIVSTIHGMSDEAYVYFKDNRWRFLIKDENEKAISEVRESARPFWEPHKTRDKGIKQDLIEFSFADENEVDEILEEIKNKAKENGTALITHSDYIKEMQSDENGKENKKVKGKVIIPADIIFLIEWDILKNDLKDSIFSAEGRPCFILPQSEAIYDTSDDGRMKFYKGMDVDKTTNRMFSLIKKESESLRAEIQRLCRAKYGMTAKDAHISEAIMALQGDANRNEKIAVNRIQYLNGVLYYDLMLPKENKLVKITKDGWNLIPMNGMLNPDNHDYFFLRYSNQLPQVIPSDTSDIELLDLHLDLQNDDKTHMLTVDTQIDFFPQIQRPLTQIEGHTDAGKSKRAHAMASLIDPQRKKNSLEPKTKRNDIVRILQQGYFIIFDNVSVLTKEQSDIFAQGITGLGQDVRALYTNDDAFIYSEFTRAILLNGMTITGTETDVLTRTNKYEVKKAHTNIPERDLAAKFEKDRPQILAGIFDNLSKTLATVEEIKKEIKIPNEVRLQDYVFYACAVSRAMGFEPEYFLKIYLETFEDKDVLALESNPLGNVLLQYMDEKAFFQGSPDQLLSELTTVIQVKKLNAPAGYPMNPKQLGEELRKIEKNLEAVGIKWTKAPGKVKNRRVYVLLNTNHDDIDPEKVGIFNKNWNPNVGVTL